MTTPSFIASNLPFDSEVHTAADRPNYFIGLWRALPRELLYLLIAFPIAVTGFTITTSLFWTGAGTIVVLFIGVFLLIAALFVARGFGTANLSLLEWTTRRPIQRPSWQRSAGRPGFFGWLRSTLGNGHYWLYLLHTALVDFVVATVTWTITLTWLSIAFGGLTYWFWSRFVVVPENDGSTYFAQWLAARIAPGLDPTLVANLVYLALGVFFAFTLPFITRGLTTLHWLVARGLLAAFRADALAQQVSDLQESRGAAISAEGQSLRRLERDIHDGPQQRLVRLQMDLAAAERQLDSDPRKARTLIAEAREQSKDALDELRALSRGFAPPILLDRGLLAALESAAARSTTPVSVESELPDGIELPQEIERNAYFVASEALVNAAKHSGATQIELHLSLRVEEQTWLDVRVTDNGAGGAVVVPDHGIAGLEERLRGLGGSLELVSPLGGPTVVSAHLPVSIASPGA
jgi:signal transduction histidine kinase